MNSRKRGAVVLDSALPNTFCCLDNRSSSHHCHNYTTTGSSSSSNSKTNALLARQTHPAVGAAREHEVAAFLGQLSLRLPIDPEELQYTTGLSGSGWQAMAEFNQLLNQHFHALSSGQLRGYHSFCTQDRESLWLSYAAASGLSVAAATPAGPQAALPDHLQLVKFILEHVLRYYHQASLTKYTFTIPHWAVGWAARWGWSSTAMGLADPAGVSIQQLATHVQAFCPRVASATGLSSSTCCSA